MDKRSEQTSPKKTHKWPVTHEKNAQYHSSSKNCKSEP